MTQVTQYEIGVFVVVLLYIVYLLLSFRVFGKKE